MMSVIVSSRSSGSSGPEADHVVDDGGAEHLLLAAVQAQALLGHDLADQLEDLAIELVARQLGRRRGVDPVVERRLDPSMRALERFDAPIGNVGSAARAGPQLPASVPAAGVGDAAPRAGSAGCRAAGRPPAAAWRPSCRPNMLIACPAATAAGACRTACAAGLPAIRSVTCWMRVGDLASPVHHRLADIGRGGDGRARRMGS